MRIFIHQSDHVKSRIKEPSEWLWR